MSNLIRTKESVVNGETKLGKFRTRSKLWVRVSLVLEIYVVWKKLLTQLGLKCTLPILFDWNLEFKGGP